MKKLFTLTVCLFSFLAMTAQTNSLDATGSTIQIPERTPALEALFQQAEYLDMHGTSAEIEANRLAIKAAWTAIDPAIGALYKPTNAPKYDRLGQGPTPYVPGEIIERPEPLPLSRDWGDDILIRNDFVDGIDMTTTLNTGDVFVGMYENEIDAGGAADNIYIYRSSTNGATWDLFVELQSPTPIRKIQLLSFDGVGDQYILAFLLFDGGLFQVARWDTSNADFSFNTISTGISDFAADRNFPASTDAMRAFVTMLKDDGCATEVFSARSTSGEYGFGWVDEVSIDGVCGAQVDFTYARAGDLYTTYTGSGSGNLYVNYNPSFNDPTTWEPRETLELGTTRETLNPTIRAARLTPPEAKVVVWASDRASGSGSNFDGVGYLKVDAGAFAVFSNFGSGGSNWNIAHTDGWINRNEGNETIRFSYVRDNIDNSENDLNRSITFNGSDFDGFEAVADSPLDVFDGFPSVTAETADGLPCLAFAGTNGTRGFGLYFDSEADILAIDDLRIEGLSYYPNPAANVVNVSAKEAIDGISIYSILGEQLLNIKPGSVNTVVSTASLASGVYVMKVTVGSRTESFKIVKN